MDLWFVVKERYLFFSILLIILLAGLMLLFAIWKNRSALPKSAVVMIIVLYACVIGLSVAGFIFAVSFGYNS